MRSFNRCLYKDIDIKYTGYNLKTMELLDYELIGVCAVIRLSAVLCTLYLVLLLCTFMFPFFMKLRAAILFYDTS